MDCLWFDKEIITAAIIVKIGLFEWKTGLNWLSCTSSTRLGLIFKDEVYDIKRQAEKSSYNGINSILEALRKAQIRLDANVNFDLVIELLLLTIKEN